MDSEVMLHCCYFGFKKNHFYGSVGPFHTKKRIKETHCRSQPATRRLEERLLCHFAFITQSLLSVFIFFFSRIRIEIRVIVDISLCRQRMKY
jgi:hypothetical protein